MNTKQLQLVTFEQAKRLDAVGFDYPVFDWYFKDGTFHKQENVKGCKGWEGWHCWKATKGIRFSAPAVALALKWLRDVKNIQSDVNYIEIARLSPKIIYKGRYQNNVLYEYIEKFTNSFDTYEAAESALLDELLTVLEKEEQQ